MAVGAGRLRGVCALGVDGCGAAWGICPAGQTIRRGMRASTMAKIA